jgi:hypothetical protein
VPQWYVAQVVSHYEATGVQLVDAIDVHFYPQGADVGGSGDDPATAALRMRSVRSWWDPSYVDESWVAAPIALLPRLRGYIAAGGGAALPRPLELAVSEYAWGADSSASAAVAHAEVLAVMAAGGVALGARWVRPAAGSRVETAYRLFLNYDGAGGAIGGAGGGGSVLAAASSDVDTVGAYAFGGPTDMICAGRPCWHVLLTNKAPGPNATSASVSLPWFGTARGTTAAQLWGFDAANPTLRLLRAVYLACGVDVDPTTILLAGWSVSVLVVPIGLCSSL